MLPQEKKSPCLSRHFLVTNSTAKYQPREKSLPLAGRKDDGAELGSRLGGDKPAVVGAQEEKGEEGEEEEGEQGEQGDGDQAGQGVSRQNVCVINACQVS